MRKSKQIRALEHLISASDTPIKEGFSVLLRHAGLLDEETNASAHQIKTTETMYTPKNFGYKI